MAASRLAFAAPLWAVVTRPAATPAASVAQRGWGAPVRRPPRWAAARLGVRRASSRRGAVVVAVAPPPPSPPSAEEGGVSSAAAAPPPLSSDAEAADALADMDGAPSAEAFAHALAFLPARRAVTIVALLGALETAFLTATKAFSSPAAICGTRGCVDVLSGPYASFLGIPLSLFGFVSYAAFAALAGWPLASPTTSPDFVRRDAATRPLMVGLSAAMVVFSAYLVSLLAFVIRSPCVYCLTSASLCAALFVLTTLVGRAMASVGATVRIGGVGGVAAALLSGVVFLTAPVKAAPQSAPPAITAVSDGKAMTLAKRLEEQGATMFGAYWCGHCYAQKQLFGADAFARIRYIECARDGVGSQAALCREKKVPGYPTWEINGALYPGEADLAGLQAILDGKVPPYVPGGRP